jgi:aryl-alcohol dehydrogenase-like predicted oxidoreductase
VSANGSRRNFLAAGLALPAAGIASKAAPQAVAPAPKLASPEILYRKLGRTGLKVSAVSFGCMVTSDGSVIERAADLGINYFDTARRYLNGNNERMVGAALKSKRKDLVISTKSGARTKAEALAELETSLKEIGTDYVDIWYLHAKTSPDQVTGELIEAQQIAKRAGKIRFAGVSTHGGFDKMLPALAQNGLIDVVLTSYNFTMDAAMDALIEELHRAGTGVVAMKVMAGGFRRLKPGEKVYNTLQKDGAMLAALKWALRNQNIDAAVPSMTDMDQLDENLKAMPESFTDNDQKVLARQLRFVTPLYCRGCGKCEGTCREGLPVPDVLRCLMYAEGYGQFALGRERYRELAVLDEMCKSCEGCTVQCPNGVRVAQRLKRAQELFV